MLTKIRKSLTIVTPIVMMAFILLLGVAFVGERQRVGELEERLDEVTEFTASVNNARLAHEGEVNTEMRKVRRYANELYRQCVDRIYEVEDFVGKR